MPEERPYCAERRRRIPRTEKGTSSAGFKLVAVQSISCAVVLIIVLLMRLAGGKAFSELRQSFNEAIMDNSILATIASLFEEGSSTLSSSSNEDTASNTDGSTIIGTEEQVSLSGGKGVYAPEGATFVPLKSNRLALPPLASGKITSGFGYREDPINGGNSFHRGVDIGAPEGSPIAAMYYGVVIEKGEGGSYGNYLRISHGDGMEILYAHCSEVLVEEGAVIREGETVARVGNTGVATGYHLHIEVKLDGIAYDPAPLLPVDLY